MNHPILVADVGGTNTRFGLSYGKTETGGYVISDIMSYGANRFENFQECLDAYLESKDAGALAGASLALAGPVTDEEIRITNRPWTISVSELHHRLNTQQVVVSNDFAALAYSTLYLPDSALIEVLPGTAIPNAARAILGPGTGFGVCTLVRIGDTWRPIPGEGGHAAFAPRKGKVMEVLDVLFRDFEYIALDRVLSGSGLCRLHRALAIVEGRVPERPTAEQITSGGIANSDSDYRRTLELFCYLVGCAAGDMALFYGARGGVYLGGGILPRIKDVLINSAFSEGFCSRGSMSHYVAHIPVFLLSGEHATLLGAAAWYYDNLKKVPE